MKRSIVPIFCFLFSILLLHRTCRLLRNRGSRLARMRALPLTLEQLVATPAVSGYENQLGDEIASALKNFHPVTDNLGDVVVTIGSGAPHRLIVTPIDEPGFVVSEITRGRLLAGAAAAARSVCRRFTTKCIRRSR